MKILSHLKGSAAALAATIVICSISAGSPASAASRGKQLHEVTVQDLLGRGGDQRQARRGFASRRHVTRRHVIGTWRIVKRNGVRMVLHFTRTGGFAMIHSSNPRVIIAGSWDMQGGQVQVKFLRVCNRKGRNCRALPRTKQHLVAFRIFGKRGNTLRTSEGTMRPVAA